MRPTLLATLACVLAAACWAAGAVVAAEAFERGITPERLAESRVVVALVPLAAYLLVARRDLLRPPQAATGRDRLMTEQIGSNRCLEG